MLCFSIKKMICKWKGTIIGSFYDGMSDKLQMKKKHIKMLFLYKTTKCICDKTILKYKL